MLGLVLVSTGSIGRAEYMVTEGCVSGSKGVATMVSIGQAMLPGVSNTAPCIPLGRFWHQGQWQSMTSADT